MNRRTVGVYAAIGLALVLWWAVDQGVLPLVLLVGVAVTGAVHTLDARQHPGRPGVDAAGMDQARSRWPDGSVF